MTFITAYVLAGIALALAVMMQFKRQDPNWRDLSIIFFVFLTGPLIATGLAVVAAVVASLTFIIFVVGFIGTWINVKIRRVRFDR